MQIDDAAWNDDKLVLASFEKHAGSIATKIKTLQKQQVMSAVAALASDSPQALIQVRFFLLVVMTKDSVIIMYY